MTVGAKCADVCGGGGALRGRCAFVHEMRRGSTDRLEVSLALVALEGLSSEDLALLRRAQGTRLHAENGAVIVDKPCGMCQVEYETGSRVRPSRAASARGVWPPRRVAPSAPPSTP